MGYFLHIGAMRSLIVDIDSMAIPPLSVASSRAAICNAYNNKIMQILCIVKKSHDSRYAEGMANHRVYTMKFVKNPLTIIPTGARIMAQEILRKRFD